MKKISTYKTTKISSKKLLGLFTKFDEEFNSLEANKGFKAISIFSGWENYIETWQIKRLDHEVSINQDFLAIYDIKYKHSYASVAIINKP